MIAPGERLIANPQPTWTLVLGVIHELQAAGRLPVKLETLILAVQRRDPGRQRGSIQPVIQGMTANAGTGPPSPCGRVLVRVQRGYYDLRPEDAAKDEECDRRLRPGRRPHDARGALRAGLIQSRLDGLVSNFDLYVAEYDTSVPFGRSGQYEFHRSAIDRRLFLGSAAAAIHDTTFTEMLHAVLQAWGIGRRGSHLVPLAELRQSLVENEDAVVALDRLNLEAPALDITTVGENIDRLVSSLGVVKNRARIVAGTKTLHHLLPDLVPPMDRKWTGAFFCWSLADPQEHQSLIFSQAFSSLAGVARSTSPSRLVGSGWHTSPTKVLDNALIGYCRTHGIVI